MAASNGSEFYELDLTSNDIESPFPRPSNAEAVAKDEEDLVLAAIERLPSVKRPNAAIIVDDSGGGERQRVISTIDVTKLDRVHRELVVKNALDTAEQDNYKLVSGVKERFQRYFDDHYALLCSYAICSTIFFAAILMDFKMDDRISEHVLII